MGALGSNAVFVKIRLDYSLWGDIVVFETAKVFLMGEVEALFE